MATTYTKKPAQVIFGAGDLGNNTNKGYDTDSSVSHFLEICRSYYTSTCTKPHFDTGRAYPAANPGASETWLGRMSVGSWPADIDTKVWSQSPDAHRPAAIAKSISESLTALGVDKVHTMYLHFPCRETPFSEVCGAMNAAFRQGKFDRWGLSNYTPADIEEMQSICHEMGYEPPRVYEGQYNAVARLGEEKLLPVLRKYDMAYVAYSPSAAGLFSGQVTADSVHKPTGRWSKSQPGGAIYADMYLKPSLLACSERVQDAAKRLGIPRGGHEVALRWVIHHSCLDGARGDGIIVGGSTLEQARQNVEICKQGPLPQELVDLMEQVWAVARPIAPFAYPEWTKEEIEKMAENLYAVGQETAPLPRATVA
ncbi:uncharacterized protein PpBr36_10638 [Pyricularia pennisetigena]|uniref:uncharacterized protein n=1 Tax=Pyricularia pennisetigena TaxID=1578925 RepID=UPI00114E7ED9|nr:uncharacterized protein PpBr36_10638 [Pyricularia pennisetigena]TLS21194.1 hypothetical protein PpBr36_10638 [Pyricularia pennisetigena]